MKHFTTLIVSLFLSLAPLSMMAQSKVAHINTQQLISEMPEVIAAQNELKKLEDQYAKELETSAKEFQKRSAEMMRPLYDKARAAIEKVAAAQGFNYVLDSSPGGSVIMATGKDLMPDVKSDLGF